MRFSVVLFLLVALPSASLAGECNREILASDKQQRDPGQLGEAEYQSLVGKKAGSEDFTFMYCVKNLSADRTIKFQWFKGNEKYAYFDDVIPPGMEKGRIESSEVGALSTSRRILINLADESRAETLYVANESEILAAEATWNKQLQTTAELSIPVSQNVLQEIEKGSYVFSDADFINLKVNVSSFANVQETFSDLQNVLGIQGQGGISFSSEDREKMEKYGIGVAGDIGTWSNDAIKLVDIGIEPLVIKDSFKTEKLHPVMKRMTFIDREGGELASMTYNLFAPQQ